MTEETGAAAPTEEAQGAETPAQTVEQATAGAEGAATQAETENKASGAEETQERADSNKPPRLSGYQRQKLRAERAAAIALEERMKREEAERKLAAASKPSGPNPDDYPLGEHDPAFIAELASAKAAEKISSELNERESARVRERADQARQDMIAEFEERVDEFKARVADYDNALSELSRAAGQGGLPRLMGEIIDSDVGPAILYQLAKNPQRAIELNSMSSRELAREIGRLEAKVSLPQPRKQTQAPKPLESPKGGAAAPRTAEEAAKAGDMATFVKLREEEEKARKR